MIHAMANVDAAGWVPMRWPCGPLEIERGRSRKGFSARDAEVLGQWCEPRSLDSLSGSPVSCLVPSWADGSPQDDAQQRALAPLAAEARKRGLALVGFVARGAELRRAIEAARAAGLDAVATESDEAVTGFPVLRFRERGLESRAPAEFLGVDGLLWPGVRAKPEDVDAETGPTGPPWLDSNAWFVRLARTLVKPRALWLGFEPPEQGQPVSAAAYAQAIADSSVFGARWLVSLDSHLRAGLAAGAATALETWRAIARSLAFFETHGAWSRYGAVEQLGVVSDYAGANQFLSFEVLNLLARQGGLSRILPTPGALEARLEDLDAVLYVDASMPSREVALRLNAYAEAGGILIVPPGWQALGSLDEAAPWLPRFELRRLGRGRLAVAREAFADPYALAEDAQVVMSHRHDRLRVYNPGTTQFHYAVSEDGRSGVLHALAHEAPSARTPMSVWFRREWASARAWSLDRAEPVPLARVGRGPGALFEPPPTPIYFALELSS
jgi:hypothetical protein